MGRTTDRRTDFANGDKRHGDRRHGVGALQSGQPERRQRDRREIAKKATSVALAALTFSGGALKSFHDHSVREAGKTRTVTGERPMLEGLGHIFTPPPSSSSPADTAHEAVAALSLPTYLNGAVEKAIDMYSDRDSFAEALARGNQVLPDIQRVFVSEGLPKDLAYVPLVESEFKSDAQSGAKARGFWQLMPRTAKHLGLEQNFWVDERSDPDKATRAAAQYLKYLHDRFGDWDLALAAYNAGEGTVSHAMKKTGKDDFWSLAKTKALPKETRDYVPRIHAVIMMAQNPGKYGIELPRETQLLATDEVSVPAGTDLRVVGQCTGIGVGEMLTLNPALKRAATPLDGSFLLDVPKGKGAEVQRCVASLPPAQLLGVQKHTVASGQTLASLAKRYNTRVKDIVAVNGISARKHLAKGSELLIPRAGVLVGD